MVVTFARKTSQYLKARSVLYAVRYAESNSPRGRFRIPSDNLALLLALCKRRSKHFTLLPVMRRILTSCFRAGSVLSFRWLPSELNYSHEGTSFLARARTSDHDCFSPSLMHVDAGEVDLTSHTRVPSVNDQSYVPSDDLSNCMGHAAAVSSQRSSTW